MSADQFNHKGIRRGNNRAFLRREIKTFCEEQPLSRDQRKLVCNLLDARTGFGLVEKELRTKVIAELEPHVRTTLSFQLAIHQLRHDTQGLSVVRSFLKGVVEGLVVALQDLQPPSTLVISSTFHDQDANPAQSHLTVSPKGSRSPTPRKRRRSMRLFHSPRRMNHFWIKLRRRDRRRWLIQHFELVTSSRKADGPPTTERGTLYTLPLSPFLPLEDLPPYSALVPPVSTPSTPVNSVITHGHSLSTPYALLQDLESFIADPASPSAVHSGLVSPTSAGLSPSPPFAVVPLAFMEMMTAGLGELREMLDDLLAAP